MIRSVVLEREEAARAPPPIPLTMKEVQTVSFHRKIHNEKQQLRRIQRAAEERQRVQAAEVRAQGYDNEKIRETYENVVAGAKELLKEFTHDVRRPKTDIRADPLALQNPVCRGR